MQVWHYWMVTQWTVVPEHHSLEIRPLAAIFTLLLQKKKKKSWKKKEKGNPEKTQPQLPKNRQPETLSSASLVFTESITSSHQDSVLTRGPWTGFLTDVAWWRVWSSQHHPAFARQHCTFHEQLPSPFHLSLLHSCLAFACPNFHGPQGPS